MGSKDGKNAAFLLALCFLDDSFAKESMFDVMLPKKYTVKKGYLIIKPLGLRIIHHNLHICVIQFDLV